MAKAKSHKTSAAASSNAKPNTTIGPGRNDEENQDLLGGAGLAPRASRDEDEDDSIFGSLHAAHEKARVGSRSPGPSPGIQTPQPQVRPPPALTSSSLASPKGRWPRTPNQVRFNLQPTIIPADDDGATTNGTATRPDESSRNKHGRDHHLHARESFDLDESDPLHSHASQDQQHRLPLLTDVEDPSVALASSRWANGGDLVHVWAATECARPTSNLSMAFMNMVNSILGAGIIGQPYAFRQAGLLAGVILSAGLTVVVDWTILLIVVNSKLSGTSSFQGTVEHCFGRPGLIAISVAQWAFAFGGMVAFGVIVGDSIPHVLVAVWPGLQKMPMLSLLADRRAVIMVFTLGISYPLTLYRDIARLAKASTLALISMVIILVTVVVQALLTPVADRGSLQSWNLLLLNDGFFQAIGVISFAFVCHHNSLLIYGSLETPTMDRFAKVTHYSTVVSMMACMVMALAGFLVFGDKTLGNVLNNFAADNSMVNVARLCFGLNMLTTLPLEAFVCREVMLNYWFRDEPFSFKRHLLLSTALVVSAMAVSLMTCDLGNVFELVGSTSAAAMAYILPPLCFIKLAATRSWKTHAAWVVVTFGCTVMGISVLQAVLKLMRGECAPILSFAMAMLTCFWRPRQGWCSTVRLDVARTVPYVMTSSAICVEIENAGLSPIRRTGRTAVALGGKVHSCPSVLAKALQIHNRAFAAMIAALLLFLASIQSTSLLLPALALDNSNSFARSARVPAV